MPDREKVAKNLEECIEHIRFNEFEKIPFWGNCQMAMTDALALLKEPEAVVRCKDCKFWYKDEGSHFCAINGDLHPANWFCADGKRK